MDETTGMKNLSILYTALVQSVGAAHLDIPNRKTTLAKISDLSRGPTLSRGRSGNFLRSMDVLDTIPKLIRVL